MKHLRSILWCVGMGTFACDEAATPPDAGVLDAAQDAQFADAETLDAREADARMDASDVDLGIADATSPEDSGFLDADLALVADPGDSRYALVGEVVTLDGSGSSGAERYQWNFGDGTGWSTPRTTSTATVSYESPGRYRAVLTVFDASGRRRAAGATISVTYAPTFSGRASSPMISTPEGLAIAVEDANQLAVVNLTSHDVLRFDVPGRPRTVALLGDTLAVTRQDDDAVDLIGIAGRNTLPLPYGSQPYGIIAHASELLVTLSGTGQVAAISVDNGVPMLRRMYDVVDDARGIAALPDGRVVVSRWRSPDQHAEIMALDLATGETTPWTLAFDPQASSDTETGGVPSYLDQLVVSPDGRRMAIPSLQANIGEGAFVSGKALTQESTVRAVVSFVDLLSGVEDFGARKQFDNRGFANAAAYSSRGDYLFVAMRGGRSVERFDTLDDIQSGTIFDVGYTPDALVVVDDRTLAVYASLSRSVSLYDVRDFSAPPPKLAQIDLVALEPLDPVILLGKRLFNDSLDTRLTREGYIACAHCHLEGDSDRRVWDFTDRGEGLRNTTSLLGKAGAGHGAIHWSANFDEVQDFEHDIRGPFGGSGLMNDADFLMGTRNQTLGDPKAGVSSDLDALAAYVSSLDAFPRSPHRPNGGLSEAALRGQALLARPDLRCLECHSGERLTDSGVQGGTPVLHDVGTMGVGSGQRLHGPLLGIDTPTLHGLFFNQPYLHDGSASTLHEVLTTRNAGDLHGVTSGLTTEEMADLESYLLSLDGRP